MPPPCCCTPACSCTARPQPVFVQQASLLLHMTCPGQAECSQCSIQPAPTHASMCRHRQKVVSLLLRVLRCAGRAQEHTDGQYCGMLELSKHGLPPALRYRVRGKGMWLCNIPLAKQCISRNSFLSFCPTACGAKAIGMRNDGMECIGSFTLRRKG